MTDILIERLEKAEGPSYELSALVVCDALAPNGCYVKQSMINGVWCIYQKNAKLWPSPWRDGGWHVTESIDAALGLVPEGWALDIRVHTSGRGSVTIWCSEHCFRGIDAATPAIALCIAARKARQQEAGQ